MVGLMLANVLTRSRAEERRRFACRVPWTCTSVRVQAESPGLMTIVECCSPLLEVIGGFLAETPLDVVRLFYMTSRCVAQQASFAMNTMWHDMYACRWRAFFEALRFQQREDWLDVYKDTLSGGVEFMLEVFDRQKKEGFAMSAMPARVHFDRDENSYVAWYISASEVPPEVIHASETHRLRFCPASVQEPLWRTVTNALPAVSELPLERLLKTFKERACCCRRRSPSPDLPRSRSSSQESTDAYPYSVLEGIDGLKVGGAVELQWKMQEQSPFGWWYGQLEELQRDADGKLATATVIFPHFHSTSQWYRLAVRFGDQEVRDCMLGGKSGGLRPVPDGEKSQWMKHFPVIPIQV